MTRGVCWLDGRIVPLDQARIPVLDHGLLYGDGVFEGVRFYGGKPFMLDEHLRRLRASARAIALELPWTDAAIARIVAETVAAFGETEGYLRLLLTRGEGPLGIDPASCVRPRLVVIAGTLRMLNQAAREAGLRLVIAATRRLPADGLDPRIKSLNYLNHILARIEANHAGADEAVMLNAQGNLAEGTAENLFLVRGGVLATPPVTDGALPGVTRGLVMALARDDGIEVREQTLAPYDLYTADECFLTGTGAGLVPVRDVDGRPLAACPGPVFRRCAARVAAHIRARCGAAPSP